MGRHAVEQIPEMPAIPSEPDIEATAVRPAATVSTPAPDAYTPDQGPAGVEPEPLAEQTAILTRASEEPAARSGRTRAPKAAKAAKPAKDVQERRARRIPAIIPSVLAGAVSGGCLVGLVAALNRWGGQTDSMNAFELLGAFVASIIAGFVVLSLGRIAHRAAIAFLGVGLVAVVLMFFPSDRWQTLTGSIIVVIATALAYAAAHAIAHEATGER